MKKRLHELIEMAERGEKFEAEHPYKFLKFFEPDFFKIERGWTLKEITSEWTVRMKREPRVQWISEGFDGNLCSNWDTKKEASRYGKPIKFIEVIEGEKNTP